MADEPFDVLGLTPANPIRWGKGPFSAREQGTIREALMRLRGADTAGAAEEVIRDAAKRLGRDVEALFPGKFMDVLVLATPSTAEVIEIRFARRGQAQQWKQLAEAFDTYSLYFAGIDSVAIEPASAAHVKDRLEKLFDRELFTSPDEDKTWVEWPRHFGSEQALRTTVEVLSTAAVGDSEVLQAFVGEDRYAAYIDRSKGGFEALVPTPSSGDAAHLERYRRLRAESRRAPVTLQAADFGEAAAGKVALRVFLPRSLVKELQQEAVRTDRSLSYLLQHALKTALPKLAKPGEGHHLAPEGLVSAELYFPLEQIRQVEAEGRRRRAGLTEILGLAWQLSAVERKALP
jgi:hypothetical protein